MRSPPFGTFEGDRPGPVRTLGRTVVLETDCTVAAIEIGDGNRDSIERREVALGDVEIKTAIG